MAKNQHNTQSPGMFGKPYKCTVCRIPQCSKNSVPVKAAATDPPQGSLKRSGKVSEGGLDDGEEVVAADTEINIVTIVPVQGPKLKNLQSMNDRFSSYINRVKNGMRSGSNVGGTANNLRADSLNDNVSSYIRRAKAKLRTTSSAGGAGGGRGGGKSVTFK